MPIGFARPAVPEDRVSNQCRIDSRKNFHALEVKTNVTDCLKVACFKRISSLIDKIGSGEVPSPDHTPSEVIGDGTSPPIPQVTFIELKACGGRRAQDREKKENRAFCEMAIFSLIAVKFRNAAIECVHAARHSAPPFATIGGSGRRFALTRPTGFLPDATRPGSAEGLPSSKYL